MNDDLTELWRARYGDDHGPPEPVPGVERLTDLLGRSVCRAYTADPVPEAVLRTLVACAQSAPSKSDLQQYAIVNVDGAEARGEIAGWLPAMPWVAEAPVLLVFCADISRGRRICEGHGRPHAGHNLDSLLNGAVDAALAMGAFITAAETLGLGCCPISHVRNHLPRLCELLALPPGVLPVAGLTLGHTRRREPVSMRMPQQMVVHRGRYDASSEAEMLAGYDRRRHERQPIAAAKQKNAARYGASEVCTWSDQVSRQISLPEREDLPAFLARHGFELG